MASLLLVGFILQITVQELKEKIVEKMVSCSRENKKEKQKNKKTNERKKVHSQTNLADCKIQQIDQI